jgi:hypothetical protein
MPVFEYASDSGLVSATANFGQRPFAYTAPSGFKALNTANLPAPVVTKPSDVMDVKLYTGNGSTQTISGLGFSPDLVWLKKRSGSEWHSLYDTIRGVEAYISTNTANAEATVNNTLTAFSSTGFTVGSQGLVNENGFTYAAWTWDAGSSTVTNTAGSISSQVRANASAGFSIVTYTGTGSNATVGHGLGVTPALIIVKCRNAGFATNWVVWSNQFASLTNNFLLLNTTASTGTITNYWGSAAPTSTVFGVAGGGYDNNHNTLNHVAYCFAPVAGYSSMGSFTTSSASTDGVFVYTNHRPRWVLIKETSATGPWIIYDAVRNTYNAANNELRPNTSEAENGGAYLGQIDILSNGFKIRSNSSAYVGEAGDFIYCSFAESPFAANNRAR